MSKRLHSIKETAELLNVGESTVWRMIRRGTLAPTRLGGRTTVSSETLDALIGRSTVAAGQAEGVA